RGRKRTIWQRESRVAGSARSWERIKMMTVRSGGSSSVFRKACGVAAVIRSGWSTMKTFRAASAGRSAASGPWARTFSILSSSATTSSCPRIAAKASSPGTETLPAQEPIGHRRLDGGEERIRVLVRVEHDRPALLRPRDLEVALAHPAMEGKVHLLERVVRP